MVHNTIAKELRTVKYRSKNGRSKKGKGSYKRKKVKNYEVRVG